MIQARLVVIRKKSFIFGHAFFSIKQTSFAPKNGWGMLVYAPESNTTRATRTAQGCTDDSVRMGASTQCE